MARHRRRHEGTQLPLLPEALLATSPTVRVTAPVPTPPAPMAEPSDAIGQPAPPVPVVAAAPAEPAVEHRAARRRSAHAGLSSADARAMVWLRARGESLSAIAQQFHVSRQTVLRFVRTPMLIRELEEQEARERQA